MSNLTLRQDLRIALPFTKRKFSLIFHLFDNQRPKSLGSISCFFLKKLLEGYDIKRISAAIPFDTSSISQRLIQLGFVEDGTLTGSGRIWAHCLEWHEQPYEAWAYLSRYMNILLPADTTVLQDGPSLGASTLYLSSKDNSTNSQDDIFPNSALKIFKFLSGQDLQPFLSELSENGIKLCSDIYKDAEIGQQNKYLVLCLPKGTVLWDDAQTPIKVSMPILRCETQYFEPQVHPASKNELRFPSLPAAQTSWTHLLDRSPAEEIALSEAPPKNFYRWPLPDWKDSLFLLASEQRSTIFSTRCSLSLFWQNGVVPWETIVHCLNKALNGSPCLSLD